MKTEYSSQAFTLSTEKKPREKSHHSLLPDDRENNRKAHALRVQLREQRALLDKAFNRYVYGKAHKEQMRNQGYVYPNITPDELNGLVKEICTLRDRVVQLRDEISYLTGEGL